MQLHAGDVRVSHGPLFHKPAKVRIALRVKSPSRGHDLLSLDPVQTALSFRRDLLCFSLAALAGHRRPASRACMLWCDVLGGRRLSLHGRCSQAMHHARVFRQSGDRASRSRSHVATSCHVVKRGVQMVTYRTKPFIRFLAHTSSEKRLLSPYVHPPPPLYFVILCFRGLVNGTLEDPIRAIIDPKHRSLAMFVTRDPRRSHSETKIFLAIRTFDVAKSAYHLCIISVFNISLRSKPMYVTTERIDRHTRGIR